MKIKKDNVEGLLKPLSSDRIMLDAFKMFFPKWKSKKTYIMIFALMIPSYLMATSEQTVFVFKDAVQLINDITLALFGIVFTGYALFQALLGKEMLVRMINSTIQADTEQKSKLQETNELFAKVMMMEFICILSCTFLLLILSCVPEDYNLFCDKTLNEVMAGCGIGLFLYMSFISFFEIKSFIFNIFQLFNFHAATRVMEILKEDK